MDRITTVYLEHVSKLIENDNHGNFSYRLWDNEIVIKPSGYSYGQMKEIGIRPCAYDIVKEQLVDSGKLKPSVDLDNHVKIYKTFPNVGAVCHTHAKYTTAFAIAEQEIQCCSTEQADLFGDWISCFGDSPQFNWVDDLMFWLESRRSVKRQLERGYGAFLLPHHGGVIFGRTAEECIKLTLGLESIAEKQAIALSINKNIKVLSESTVDKWHERYYNSYGQTK